MTHMICTTRDLHRIRVFLICQSLPLYLNRTSTLKNEGTYYTTDSILELHIQWILLAAGMKYKVKDKLQLFNPYY